MNSPNSTNSKHTTHSEDPKKQMRDALNEHLHCFGQLGCAIDREEERDPWETQIEAENRLPSATIKCKVLFVS